jgi:hypothetical protein
LQVRGEVDAGLEDFCEVHPPSCWRAAGRASIDGAIRGASSGQGDGASTLCGSP